MRAILAVTLALLALGAGKAQAATPPPDGGNIICFNCDGSGACFEEQVSSYSNTTGGVTTAHAHWCTDWAGHIWSAYGWATHNWVCCAPAIQFVGYNPAYWTGNGYDATGVWQVGIPTPFGLVGEGVRISV